MRAVINGKTLGAYWTPAEWGHTSALAPFLAVHAAYAEHRTRGGAATAPFQWEWADVRAVEDCLSAAWNMTGKWQARRLVTMPRTAFDSRVVEVVPPLARRLNALGIHCMRDLSELDARVYVRAVHLVHDAVRSVSTLRATKDVEPVLGSKVLHHFFPSLVPVFDTAFIRNAVMRTAAFRSFKASDPDGWLVYSDAASASGRALLEFHRYFAFAGAQVASIPKVTLDVLRERFARGFRRLAPGLEIERPNGIVRRMDSKLAEYCLLGHAHAERLLAPRTSRASSRW